MSADRPRVAVTGLGTVNPLGGDVDSTWKAALAGTPTTRTLDTTGSRSTVCRSISPAR
jgi:3-oxoacyl-[acyl-carrier-protein] synthase II